MLKIMTFVCICELQCSKEFTVFLFLKGIHFSLSTLLCIIFRRLHNTYVIFRTIEKATKYVLVLIFVRIIVRLFTLGQATLKVQKHVKI